MKKTIITVAVTGSIGDKSTHPDLPVTPKDIARSAVEAASAGASVAHIHVRNTENCEPSMEYALYQEVVERIRAESDILINLTTGAGARIVPNDASIIGLGPGTTWSSPEKRVEHVVGLKPELCSLDCGSLNFGSRVFANPIPHVEKMAMAIQKAGVKPELEVFDIGHIEIANQLLKKCILKSPPIFQLCLGIKWGIPASTKTMLYMKDFLPQGSIWGGFAIGKTSFPMATQAALLGGNVRVGFEDNFFLFKGKPAKTNAQLVEKMVIILKALDKEPASFNEAREILNIEKKL